MQYQKSRTATEREKEVLLCTVVSNGGAVERNRFFDMLTAYKKVDSGGGYMNNVAGPVKNKLEFIKDYKFVLAFENSSYPGYTTEKIVEPMLVGSIPIHWGSPVVGRDFNTKSFVNLHDFSSFEEGIKRIVEIDEDDNLYLSYLREPWFPDNRFPEALKFDAIAANLRDMVDKCMCKKPVSSNWFYPISSKLNRRRKKLLSRIYKKPHFYF